MIRLLHIINSTNPAGGGPIESIRQAHRALKVAGHQFEIACLDRPDSPWLPELGMPVTALGPAISKYRYSPRFEPWLRENAGRFDAAIVHGIWLYPSASARRVFRDAGRPYFVYTHGLLDPTLQRVFPLKHAAKAACWRLFEHRVIRDATAVFFTGDEERRLAEESFKPFKANGVIVPYCVGGPEGDASSQREKFLARFPECCDARLILFLSRIHAKKGCDLVLESFAAASARDRSLRLVMAGPDSTGWQATLQERARVLGIEGRITWTGMLSGDLKWGAFHNAEAFILPSHQENFGIAVVEALACNVPVLITDRVNIWREIETDGAAIVEHDDESGAKRMLERWLDLDQKKRETMRANARACFAKRFSSEKAAANLLNVLAACGVRGK